MKKIEIKHRWTGDVLFTAEVEDSDLFPMRTAVRQAIAARADLRSADLRSADLSSADLSVIRDDVRAILDVAPLEVAGLLDDWIVEWQAERGEGELIQAVSP